MIKYYGKRTQPISPMLYGMHEELALEKTILLASKLLLIHFAHFFCYSRRNPHPRHRIQFDGHQLLLTPHRSCLHHMDNQSHRRRCSLPSYHVALVCFFLGGRGCKK